MAYIVSGATGFIGRRLVERLLTQRPDAVIHVLTRERSLPRLERLINDWGQADPDARERIRPLVGDLLQPLLGASDDVAATGSSTSSLRGGMAMTADTETDWRANVEGTHNAIELAAAVGAGCLHHMSSIAVAGHYAGVFREDMFDEGQPLTHPYHLTKFEAERVVRRDATVPWRIYRPSIVVGDSRTGSIDKIDGPSYFFSLIKRAGERLPGWLPLLTPDLGYTNIVPVDYVVSAIDHIAHEPGLDGRAFHLVSPRRQRAADVINAVATPNTTPVRRPAQRRSVQRRAEGCGLAALASCTGAQRAAAGAR